MKNEPPSEKIFNEIKDAAISIWNTYDNTHGYVTEKVNRVNSITNIQDNVMSCYRMFDGTNQRKMRAILSPEALVYIDENN